MNGRFGTGRGRGTLPIGPRTVSDLNTTSGTSRSSVSCFSFLFFSSSSLPQRGPVLLLLCRLNISESVRFTQIENRTCKRTFFVFLSRSLRFHFFSFFFLLFSTFLIQCFETIDAMGELTRWILALFYVLGEYAKLSFFLLLLLPL